MISKWKVHAVEVAGNTFFEVFRTTDAASKKNREERFGGYWTTEAEAQSLADKLNEEEKNERIF